MSFQVEYENFLMHHGVKGMKWGVRKKYIPHPRKKKSKFGAAPSSRKEREQKDKEYDAKEDRRNAILGGLFGIGSGAAAGAVGVGLAATTGIIYIPMFVMAAAGVVVGTCTVVAVVAERAKAKRAIKRSNKERDECEIDKKTGLHVKKDKFFSEKDVKSVNPWFDTSDASSTNNCVACTAAIEMRNRGYEVRAKKTTVGYFTNEVQKVYKNSKVVKHAESSNPFERLSTQQCSKTVSDLTKKDSRGHMLVKWPGGGGHSIYYVSSGGNLKIYDGQIGKVVAKNNKESEFYISNTRSVETIRVDNCQVDLKKMKELIE